MKNILISYSAETNYIRELIFNAETQGYSIHRVSSQNELLSVLKNNARISLVVSTLDFFYDDLLNQNLVKKINKINEILPIFVLKEPESGLELDFDQLEFIYLFRDFK